LEDVLESLYDGINPSQAVLHLGKVTKS
jgi:hypothetical protein